MPDNTIAIRLVDDSAIAAAKMQASEPVERARSDFGSSTAQARGGPDLRPNAMLDEAFGVRQRTGVISSAGAAAGKDDKTTALSAFVRETRLATEGLRSFTEGLKGIGPGAITSPQAVANAKANAAATIADLRKSATAKAKGGGGSGIVGKLPIIGAAVLAIGKAGHAIADVMHLAAFRINKATEIAAAKIRGDQQNAEVAEIEKRFGSRERIVGMLPLTETLGIKAMVQGQKEIEVARAKEFSTIRDALRERTKELSAFSPQIARQQAIGQMNQTRRDLGEAAIIGGQLAGVEAQQQQLDRINQQISILDRIEEAGKQTNRLNAKIAEQQAILNEKIATLPEDMKRKIKELEEQAKDPLQDVIDAGGFHLPTEAPRRAAPTVDARPPLLLRRDLGDL